MSKRICLVAAGLLALSGVHAEENTLKEGAKEIGHATGTAVHQVGQGAKKVGKEVAGAAREVGHATRDGAKEFASAVKGESGQHKTTAKDPKAPAPSHLDK